jgi:hypothetical protein
MTTHSLSRGRLTAAIVMVALAAALLVGVVELPSRATGATGHTACPGATGSDAYGPSDGYGPSPDQANGNYYTADEDGASGADGAIGYYGPGGPGDPNGATGCVGPTNPTGATGATGATGWYGSTGCTGPPLQCGVGWCCDEEPR